MSNGPMPPAWWQLMQCLAAIGATSWYHVTWPGGSVWSSGSVPQAAATRLSVAISSRKLRMGPWSASTVPPDRVADSHAMWGFTTFSRSRIVALYSRGGSAPPDLPAPGVRPGHDGQTRQPRPRRQREWQDGGQWLGGRRRLDPRRRLSDAELRVSRRCKRLLHVSVGWRGCVLPFRRSMHARRCVHVRHRRSHVQEVREGRRGHVSSVGRRVRARVRMHVLAGRRSASQVRGPRPVSYTHLRAHETPEHL